MHLYLLYMSLPGRVRTANVRRRRDGHAVVVCLRLNLGWTEAAAAAG